MLLKIIVLIITSLGVIYWLIRMQDIQHPNEVRQDSSPKGDQGESKDEIDDTQTVEVVATWNLLNPP